MSPQVTTQRAIGDVQKLWRDYRVSVRNCVDLSLLARTVDNARWKGKYSQPIALARLCEAYEELTLQKGKITRSNWERELTEAQQLCKCAPLANSKYHRLTPAIMCRCCQRLSLWTYPVEDPVPFDKGDGSHTLARLLLLRLLSGICVPANH